MNYIIAMRVSHAIYYLVVPKNEPIKYIDLFAGIGGFHAALLPLGGECVFASEWDDAARRTYEFNFRKRSPGLFHDRENSLFAGDITKIDPSQIPDFSLLCGGFPCQPFSQAGLKKGLEEERGTLFENIADILEAKKPAAFFLENVRGLLTHKSGSENTLDIILGKLESLGYVTRVFRVKASDFGVPQHRPRIFIIGFRDKTVWARFTEPSPVKLKKTMSDVFKAEVTREIGYTLRVGGRGSGLNDRRNWDTYLVDGKERRIGPTEGLVMQGFPRWFKFPATVSESAAMKQLGNSVAVPAIRAYAEAILKALA
jgi:DNA (cytosine-5)-methyltransferase 1